ncbi:MAG: flagellar protein FliT [Burkholderiaceae bacterium]|jgi:flagellar protein FliT|nr:flagellar protein FliT [Burkholderiaceae bacterium]
MKPCEIINVYERLACLTSQMAQAANDSRWGYFEQLDGECVHVSREAKRLPRVPLSGDALRKKISLLKQIMANDRLIRDVTEPWQQQLKNVASS